MFYCRVCGAKMWQPCSYSGTHGGGNENKKSTNTNTQRKQLLPVHVAKFGGLTLLRSFAAKLGVLWPVKWIEVRLMLTTQSRHLKTWSGLFFVLQRGSFFPWVMANPWLLQKINGKYLWFCLLSQGFQPDMAMSSIAGKINVKHINLGPSVF